MKFIFSLVKRIQLFIQIRIIERGLLKSRIERTMFVLFGPIYFQVFMAALQFDLFSQLSKLGPQTRSQISQLLNISDKPTRILLSVLVATGFLKRTNSSNPKYHNTIISKIFFDRNSKKNVISIAEWYHFICYKPMFWTFDSLKANTNIGIKEIPGTEPNLYQRLAHLPDLERVFENAMEQLSLTANKMLAEFVDLSEVNTLVDIGGGNGTNIIALTKKYPNLKGIVFDSKTVCNLANENIIKHKMEKNCSVHPGDCFKNNFPQPIDCVLFSHFLDIWDEEENIFLLKKAYDALPEKGRVIILEVPQWENERGPHAAISTTPYFLTLASGKGYMYTSREYIKWLKSVGFSKIQCLSLPQEHMAITGFKISSR